MYAVLYIVIAVIIQLLAGNFPITLMRFPVNLILSLIWFFILFWLYRKENLKIIRWLLSLKTSILSLVLFIAGCLVIGLFPQLSQADMAVRNGVFAALGCYDFATSWIFVAILWLLLSNLALVIFRACVHYREGRWRFLLNHIGLWLALFGGFAGSCDTYVWNVPVYQGVPTNRAYDGEGLEHRLNYSLELHSFSVERYPNGMPSSFEAVVYVGEGRKRVELTVNHPFHYKLGEDIYLSGYDTTGKMAENYCVLQIVKQPWRYVTATGICMMLLGAVLLFMRGPEYAGKLG